MKSLEQLKNEIDLLERKAMVYSNELNDAVQVKALDEKIKELNMLVLDLMVGEQSERINAATIV